MASVTTLPLNQESNDNKMRNSSDIRLRSKEWPSEFVSPREDTQYKSANFFGALPTGSFSSYVRSASNSSADIRIPSDSSIMSVLAMLDKEMPRRLTSKSSIDMGSLTRLSSGTFSNLSSLDFGTLKSNGSVTTDSIEPLKGVSTKDWATAHYLRSMGVGKSPSRSSSGSFSPDESAFKESIERSVESTISSAFQNASSGLASNLEISKPSSLGSNKARQSFQTRMKPPAPVNPQQSTIPKSDTVAAIMSIMERSKLKDATKKPKPRVRKHAKEPENKEYVEQPRQVDVLFGRGTGPRLHPGNQRYYTKVGQLRDEYRSGKDADKKRISRLLVNWVKESGGRFLKQDSKGRYFVVPELGARSKACQALREHKFPSER